ncbi:MAG: TolC family protein [Desulfobacterales bacterium]
MEIEVLDLIRNVESRLKQLDLARRARKLSKQKLEIEQEKLRAGMSSNFQIVTFQNDLLNAQNSEVVATIDYRNALTALDQVQGTTLDT